MRGFLQPLFIVIAVVLIAFGVSSFIRTFSSGPADWQPGDYQCSTCNGQNIVDGDIIYWTCKWCHARHWNGDGKLDPNRPAGK